MRVALLAADGPLATMLEELADARPEPEISLVWTVFEPGSVLAALDHDPQVYVLDMRWGEAALTAAGLLRDAGVPLIVALFDRLDDALIPDARTMGLEVFCLPTPSPVLLEWLQGAG